MADDNEISVRLRFLRLKHFGHRGKRAFANAIGIPLSTYASYESGRNPPSDVLVKISEITSCDLKWLMTGRASPEAPATDDPEISEILSRLGKTLIDDPKAKQAVNAMVDLLTRNQSRPQPVDTEEVMAGQSVIPIIGSAAAGIPAFWIEEETPFITLADIANSLEAGELEDTIFAGIHDPQDPDKIAGQVEILNLTQPLELHGLFIDGLIITDSVKTSGKIFGVRINGDSMLPVLKSGDIVLSDTSEPAIPNALALAELLDRVGAICKLYLRDGSQIRLSSLNRKYDPIITTKSKIRWAYKVVGVVRS